jgi:prophage DNA circulation protein
MAEAAQTWRDKLQQASFRGIPFKVESTSGDVGRRNVIHEYPQRDLPLAEDLGRKAREFTLEGFVIGDQYMTGRDKLIEAIEAKGAGELVHPYRGRIQVVVASCRVSESTAEGGMAKFSLSFTESGELTNPKPSADTGAAVKAAADAAQVETEAGFFDDFNVDGLQDFVPTEALAMVTGALNSIQTAATKLLGGGLLPEFTNQLFSMVNSASSLIRLPGSLAAGLFNQVKALAGIADRPLSALAGLRSLFSFGSTAKPVPNSIPPTQALPNFIATPSRQQQAANQSAVISLVQRAAVIEAARVSTKITPASYGEAIALRNELADKLETLAETAPDKVYAVLMTLRIAVIKDITSRAADLSRTVQYPVPATLPALVVTYGLYGDVEQADSLIARNKIRHPGFVPGGRAIEVLT